PVIPGPEVAAKEVGSERSNGQQTEYRQKTPHVPAHALQRLGGTEEDAPGPVRVGEECHALAVPLSRCNTAPIPSRCHSAAGSPRIFRVPKAALPVAACL